MLVLMAILTPVMSTPPLLWLRQGTGIEEPLDKPDFAKR
jgi:hypothetical protein